MIYSLLDQYTLLSSSNVIFEGLTEFSCLAIIVSSSYQSDFGSYLAGLIEGDGAIVVPEKGVKSYRPFIEIVFHIADLPLCKTIQLIIGGNIYMSTNHCRLIIKKKLSVLKIIYLINGKFRTPKIEALHRMIN